MKPEIIIAAMVLAMAGTSHAVAQDAAASQAPTPEAAAKFIDTVLGSGGVKAAELSNPNTFTGAISVEGARTGNCRTVIFSPSRSPLNDRWRLEVDWRKFVAANSFFPADANLNRWVVRLLASTAENLADKDDIDKLDPKYETEQFIGIAIETGTEELKDRLIRAMEFYGKSCAPQLDGPF